MKRWLAFPSVWIALCVAVFGAFAWWAGPFATVIASPLLGVAIARPVLTLLANSRHGVRAITWLPVHGHHYVFKGITINVLEDDGHWRWVPIADANKVVAIGAGERVMLLVYPGRYARMGKPAQPCLRADALIELLARQGSPAALRFRTWVARNIAFPASRIRNNLGIRPQQEEGP